MASTKHCAKPRSDTEITIDCDTNTAQAIDPDWPNLKPTDMCANCTKSNGRRFFYQSVEGLLYN